MTDSDPSDIAQRCMLDSGFGMGVSAVGRHHTDGTVTLKVGDYTEQVNHCPKCGKPSDFIEALQELVGGWNNCAERSQGLVDKHSDDLSQVSANTFKCCADELQEVIEQYE